MAHPVPAILAELRSRIASIPGIGTMIYTPDVPAKLPSFATFPMASVSVLGIEQEGIGPTRYVKERANLVVIFYARNEAGSDLASRAANEIQLFDLYDALTVSVLDSFAIADGQVPLRFDEIDFLHHPDGSQAGLRIAISAIYHRPAAIASS